MGASAVQNCLTRINVRRSYSCCCGWVGIPVFPLVVRDPVRSELRARGYIYRDHGMLNRR